MDSVWHKRALALGLRAEGLTYRQIGVALGYHHSRASVLVHDGNRRLRAIATRQRIRVQA